MTLTEGEVNKLHSHLTRRIAAIKMLHGNLATLLLSL